MKITLSSILVDDQAKAVAFYTDVLGFEKKVDIPLGEHRWLTAVSAAEPDGVQLVLEPDEHPAAKPFKAALVEDGIPFASFAVDDVEREAEGRGWRVCCAMRHKLAMPCHGPRCRARCPRVLVRSSTGMSDREPVPRDRSPQPGHADRPGAQDMTAEPGVDAER